MFTGIIEKLGTVENLRDKQDLRVLRVSAGERFTDVSAGESIAVNGVCLTVTEASGGKLIFEAVRETLERTTLGDIREGDKLNLERALRADSRLGGHFVTGHIDGVGEITRIAREGDDVEFRIGLSEDLMRYIAPKGSVALEGISLTVGDVGADGFSVHLIPYTLQITTLGEKKEKDRVNVETDLLAKYVIHGCKEGGANDE